MFYIVLIIWITIDLITKYIAKQELQNTINIIENFLYLQYIENTGIAFSIPIPSFFLKIITIILIFVIFCYYFKEERKKKNLGIDISFAFILAGAIGNGIERIMRWYVIDFIGIQYFSIFNIADICISWWVILYIYINYLKKQPWALDQNHSTYKTF